MKNKILLNTWYVFGLVLILVCLCFFMLGVAIDFFVTYLSLNKEQDGQAPYLTAVADLGDCIWGGWFCPPAFSFWALIPACSHPRREHINKPIAWIHQSPRDVQPHSMSVSARHSAWCYRCSDQNQNIAQTNS